MANADYSAIKAGVNGMIDDAPGPSADTGEMGSSGDNVAAGETVEMQPQEQQPAEQQQYMGTGPSYGQASSDEGSRIQEIAEAIINEKWQELLSSVGNIAVWKEKVDTNILSVKQEIVRINERFDNLQNAVLGKIKEYDGDMRNVTTEMKALEKVFEKIIEPLTSNVKELNRITKEMKEMRQ